MHPIQIDVQGHKYIAIFTLATAGICMLVGYWLGSSNHISSENVPSPAQDKNIAQQQAANTLQKISSGQSEALATLQSFSNSHRIKQQVIKQIRDGSNQSEEDIKKQVLGKELQKLHYSYRQTTALAQKTRGSRLGAYCPYDMQDPRYQQTLDILAQQEPKIKTKNLTKQPKWWVKLFNKRLLSLQPHDRKPVQKATRHRRSLLRFSGALQSYDDEENKE